MRSKNNNDVDKLFSVYSKMLKVTVKTVNEKIKSIKTINTQTEYAMLLFSGSYKVKKDPYYLKKKQCQEQ